MIDKLNFAKAALSRNQSYIGVRSYSELKLVLTTALINSLGLRHSRYVQLLKTQLFFLKVKSKLNILKVQVELIQLKN